MFNPSATPSYMNPGERVRRQWHAFEQWVETVPRAAMEQEISQHFQDEDTKWNATPARSRPARQDHDRTKAAYRKDLEDGLVLLAREEWQRRLQAAGLRDEDWGEMSFKETLAAERLLGGDLDEEGMAIMEDIAREEDATPALSRKTNFSGYSFVSPMSLSIADDLDDEPEGFESIYPFEIPASSGPASVASLTDEIFDTPTIPWGWTGGDAASYGIWSAATSQSSRQSSQTSSPERPPKATLPDHSLFPRTQGPLPPRASAARASVGPRYIGPQLTDPDEVFHDEAAFERFKMDTRIAKIREFHDEAARADIQLARDIYDVRKTRATETGRAEATLKIAAHETFMIELRRRKEEERQAIVKAERHKRRQEIASRPAVGAESLKQRLTQEVESSLFKMGNGGGFVGAPDAAAVLSAAEAETRRARRQSMTATTNVSETPTIRKSDRMAASVSDLLETASTISFASSTTTTTAASSSSARPQIWIPPTEGTSTDTTPVKPKPNKKKGGSQASAVVDTPTAKSAAVPGKPTKKSVPLPPVVDVATPAAVPVVPKGPSPPAKTVVSTLSKSSGKALSPPAPSPPVSTTTTTKAPTPPVSKGPSPPAAKGPTPPVSQGPSPPVSKGPSPPVSKGPSPPVSKGPSPPVSKGPSPPVSKGPTPPVSKVPSPPAAPSKASTASAQAQSKVSASINTSTSTTKVPTPPLETPKPANNPSAVPKAARVVQGPVEIETPGASSSRTTLEQMQRPFIHKSLASSADLWMGLPPPMAAPAHGVWVSSSASANAKKLDTSTIKITPGTHSTKIEKVPSMPIPQQPQPRLPLFAGAGRARRMSDPVSPSPRSFLYGVNGSGNGNNNPPSSSKKGKGTKQGKNKRTVTVEEVSDEEDGAPAPDERLPADSKVIFEDSKVIFEPKPSVPPTMYTPIFDFTSDTPKPPMASGIRSSQGGKGSGFLTADGKNAKDKHVRWTPSAMGNDGGGDGGGGGDGNALRAALEGFEAAANAPAPVPAPVTGKGRRRTNSLLQQATGAIDRKGKGKGKERAVPEPEMEADFERFVMGATLDLGRG